MEKNKAKFAPVSLHLYNQWLERQNSEGPMTKDKQLSRYQAYVEDEYKNQPKARERCMTTARALFLDASRTRVAELLALTPQEFRDEVSAAMEHTPSGNFARRISKKTLSENDHNVGGGVISH
ncbi:MAG: hypothetical protein KGI29_08515 [Pseudomonadota bacterium]|nr:hypothetical protein [Pseudomonadota bacterium]MDE3038410.1 hypothetical protein [Pseudomonadota bacterium]